MLLKMYRSYLQKKPIIYYITYTEPSIKSMKTHQGMLFLPFMMKSLELLVMEEYVEYCFLSIACNHSINIILNITQ